MSERGFNSVYYEVTVKKRHDLDTASIVKQLRSTLDELRVRATSVNLATRARRALDSEIREVMAQLGRLLHELDPIRQPTAVFDPGNPKIIGRFIALALVAQPRVALSAVQPFYGAGVYAIYYRGPFAQYAAIAGSETPIYIGQAAPAAQNARTPLEQGDRLTSRLADHRRSIGKAISTLDTNDLIVALLSSRAGGNPQQRTT